MWDAERPPKKTWDEKPSTFQSGPSRKPPSQSGWNQEPPALQKKVFSNAPRMFPSPKTFKTQTIQKRVPSPPRKPGFSSAPKKQPSFKPEMPFKLKTPPVVRRDYSPPSPSRRHLSPEVHHRPQPQKRSPPPRRQSPLKRHAPEPSFRRKSPQRALLPTPARDRSPKRFADEWDIPTRGAVEDSSWLRTAEPTPPLRSNAAQSGWNQRLINLSFVRIRMRHRNFRPDRSRLSKDILIPSNFTSNFLLYKLGTHNIIIVSIRAHAYKF